MITPQWGFRQSGRVLLRLGPLVFLALLPGLLFAGAIHRGLIFAPALALLGIMYAFPTLLGLALAARQAARFAQTLYKIRTLEEAASFVYRRIFGLWSFAPFLLIKEGKIASGENSVLHRVGGPGYLVIYNDTAVVTERCGRLERILSAHFPRQKNYPYLEPFEKVWEVVDLRPQQWAFPVTGMTRDGIPVTCEADIRFKIDDRPAGGGPPKPPTDYEPYPFTPEAVFKAATARWVRDPDSKASPMDWRGRVVVGFTEGILRNILAEYYLDWLLGPTGEDTEHPREVIRRRLEEELQKEAPKVGARILSVQLGEIKVDEEQLPEIPTQWIEAWQAEWESQTAAIRVEGEAELLRMEAVRARAQAEMLITLIRELQSVAISDAELRPYLLAARLAETLRWMSYDPFTRAFLPPEAIRTLQRLQELLGEERRLPGSG